MRKIILVLSVLFLIASSLKAQEEGTYKSYPQLDPYVGTWQWQSKDSVFTITLVKTVSTFEGNSADILFGWHELSVGKQVIQSTMHLKSDKYDNTRENQSISAFWDFQNNNYVLLGYFKDVATGLTARGGSMVLKNNNKRLVMVVYTSSFTRDLSKYSLPTNITFKKIR